MIFCWPLAFMRSWVLIWFMPNFDNLMYKLPGLLMVLTIEFFIEDFWVHQCWKILHEKGEWRPRDA